MPSELGKARRRLGEEAEKLAACHLAAQGWRILERNYRSPLGEIDIVAQEGDELVIVEVRAKRGDSHGTAAESVTTAKAARLRDLAESYVQQLQPPPVSYRVDVIALEYGAGGPPQLEHIRDALA